MKTDAFTFGIGMTHISLKTFAIGSLLLSTVLAARGESLRCQELPSYSIERSGNSGTVRLKDSEFQARFEGGDIKPAVPVDGRVGLQWVKNEAIAGGRHLSYGLDNSTKPPTVQATVTPGRDGEGPVLNLTAEAKARWSLDELLFVARSFPAAKCEAVKP
jgi:hypothetical protein